MKRFCTFLSMTVLVCFVAPAQNIPPADAPKAQSVAGESKAKVLKSRARAARESAEKKTGADEKKKGAEGTEAAKPAVPAVEIKGDVVTLKSGAQLKGVQVLSQTANEVEVDVGAGVVLVIPRRQVQHIQPDDIEPKRTKQPADASQKGDLFPGNKLKPEVSGKLTAPLQEPIKYEKTDLVKALGELSERCGVAIVVDEPVKSLSENERLWTIETKPGMNLMGVLQDDFLKKFPALAVVYQFDKLLVTTKEKAAALAAQEPAQVPTPPTAAAAPQANPPASPQTPAAPSVPPPLTPEANPPAVPQAPVPPSTPPAPAPQAPSPTPPQSPAVPSAPEVPAPQVNTPASPEAPPPAAPPAP